MLKKLFLVSLISLSSFAAVNFHHAMNVFKGDYKFEDPFSGDEVSFSITKKGKITLKENDSYYFAKVNVNSLGNELGPDGLSIMTIMLAGGSDEQTYTAFITIYPQQDVTTQVRLVDFFMAENDGPNELSSIYREAINLQKKDKKTNKFIKIIK